MGDGVQIDSLLIRGGDVALGRRASATLLHSARYEAGGVNATLRGEIRAVEKGLDSYRGPDRSQQVFPFPCD